MKTKLLDVNASEEVFEEGGMGLEDGATDGESFDTLTLTTNSNTAKDRISLVKSEECHAHLNYLPFWRKPVARQYWVKTDYGFVSSLSINKENRAATPADLVFDLVFVVLLNRLGRALRRHEADQNPQQRHQDIRDNVRKELVLVLPIVVDGVGRHEYQDESVQRNAPSKVPALLPKRG